ncbi:MAG: GntR family transcriptional regulator [Rhodobacterales bacterium 32-67-9]|nr:MAG: GntR family transcriptional regulator [Rhodobacterales bacterium 32-67-9]
MQRLARTSLVELIPRRGAFVRQPGPLEIVEMFEAMAEFEASCARLAAKRITDRALDDLRAANERCRAAVENGNPDTYYAENEAFHLLIYEQCGNAYIQQEALRLHRRLKPYRRLQLRVRGRMKQSMSEHEAIVAAMAAGEAEVAASTIRDHVAIQGEKFHTLLASLKETAA